MRTSTTLFVKVDAIFRFVPVKAPYPEEDSVVPSPRRRAVVTAVVVGLGAIVPITAGHASAAETTGTVYVVQGVADTPMTITVDGKTVATAAAAKTIVGPLTLSAGSHAVAAETPTRTETVSASVSVTAGSNLDAVLHRQVDPSKPPVITTFPNDLSSVASGSGRLVVAHTAAVGPADVRVDQKVLFANIANGEALTVTVPANTYNVDIVPTATSGPVVFGPAKVPVAPTALTRVFAIGVAATSSMDAVVQVLPLSVRGTGAMPSTVNAGDGGQAAELMAATNGTVDGRDLMVVALLAVIGAAAFLALRRRSTARSRAR
jgi:hypothetical protein